MYKSAQFYSQFASVLGHFLGFSGKRKDAQRSDRSFCMQEFFFVRFLDFELWWILYLTVVNSVLDFAKNLVGFIAKYAVDANLFRLGSLILKDAGSRSTAPVRGGGPSLPPIKKKMLFKFLLIPG